MSDVKSAILTSGKILLTQALTSYKLFRPHHFDVASAVGFDPQESDTVPNGPIVYSGSRNQIQVKQLAPDTARYIMVIPEGAGPFVIGNLMMYAENDTGSVLPFAYVVLPFPYTKTISDPNLSTSLNNSIPIPGNRFVCNITIKHSITATSITVEVVTPTFSSLAFYEDIATVPPPVINPWKTFVVHTDVRQDTPALVTKRNDDTYWAIPFWQPFRSPSFGTIDGGIIGDNYKADQSGFLWGYEYLTPEVKFSGKLGGSSYTAEDGDFTGSIGGKPY